MQEALNDLLNHFIKRAHYSSGRLARLSGIPKQTIVNWSDGRVKKPHQWQGLVKLAAVLHLDEGETSRLLQAAGHKPVAELR